MQIHYYDACLRTIKQEKWLLLWLWGCNLNCTECANLACMDPTQKISQEFIFFNKKVNTYLRNIPIKGLIISGGEPFKQPQALNKLIHLAKKHNWYIIVYSGYYLKEIRAKNNNLLKAIDILIDGPYLEKKRVHHAFYGSTNQKMHIFNSSLEYLKNINPSISYYTKSLNGVIMRV